MNPRIAFGAISISVGLLLVASLLLFNTDTSRQVIGALYMLGGATVVACAKFVPSQAMAPALPALFQPFLRARPTTFVLWGCGIVIFGVLLTSGFG